MTIQLKCVRDIDDGKDNLSEAIKVGDIVTVLIVRRKLFTHYPVVYVKTSVGLHQEENLNRFKYITKERMK